MPGAPEAAGVAASDRNLLVDGTVVSGSFSEIVDPMLWLPAAFIWARAEPAGGATDVDGGVGDEAIGAGDAVGAGVVVGAGVAVSVGAGDAVEVGAGVGEEVWEEVAV